MKLKPIPALELKELAEKWAGNYLKFDSYINWRNYAEPEAWMVLEPVHRDSDALARSNAAVMERELAQFSNPEDEAILDKFGGSEPVIIKGDFFTGNASHFLVGWTRQFIVRIHRNGVITPAFTLLMQMLRDIEDYPILDEDHHSELELEDAIATIKSIGHSHVKGGAPKDWEYEVEHALTEEGRIGDYEVANCIGEDEIFGAMKKLNIFEEDE